MNIKSLSIAFLAGMMIYLGSCAKNDSPDPNPVDPNPIDTTKHDTTKTDTTTHIDTTNHTDTNSSNSHLSYPTSFIFKSTVIPETEYYQMVPGGRIKVSEPYYMRYNKNLLQSTIKDDHSLPFKEIRFVSADKVTIIYKDSSIVENNIYSLKDNQHLYLQNTGYLGTFNADKTQFNINLSPFTYSNDGNRPMYARLYLAVSYSPDKNKTMDYLVFSQSLLSGDTLAINFSQFVYNKK
jgi:hypothetical protein